MTKPETDNRLIALAIAEDRGPGDITTAALGLKGKRGRAVVYAKADGVISGLTPFMKVFKALSPAIRFTIYKHDGQAVVPKDKIIGIHGSLDAILTGERTAMNILCQLSGVASLTSALVQKINGYPVKLLDTRKTIPGMRAWQKKAVQDGGAVNHRMGLYDMYLIKENHITAAGGLREALGKVARHRIRTKARIEVEVKNLDELRLVMTYRPDYILLDNFSLPQLKKAVKIARNINPRALLEASGNVGMKTIRQIAAAGVDRISMGKITHSAPALDLSMIVLD